MKLTIVLKKHDAEGLGGQILTDMGMTRSAYEPDVFTTRHVQDPRIVAPVDVTEQMWPVMYVEALMDEGIRPMRVYQKDNSTLALTPLWASVSGKPDPQAVADVLEAAANTLEASAAKACICDEYPDDDEDDEVSQTTDNWQGEGCENYDDSQDVCLDEVTASQTRGLGPSGIWDLLVQQKTPQEVRRLVAQMTDKEVADFWRWNDRVAAGSMDDAAKDGTLPEAIGDLRKQLAKDAADEVVFQTKQDKTSAKVVQKGGHLKAAKKPLGVSDKEFWALLSDKKTFQQLLENTERHHKAQKEWEDAAPVREALEKAEKEADATWAKLTPEQKRRYRRDDRIWDHPFGAAGVAHEDKLAGKLTASKGGHLFAGMELTDEEAACAVLLAGLKPFARAERLEEAGLGGYNAANPLIQALAKKGLVKLTKTTIIPDYKKTKAAVAGRAPPAAFKKFISNPYMWFAYPDSPVSGSGKPSIKEVVAFLEKEIGPLGEKEFGSASVEVRGRVDAQSILHAVMKKYGRGVISVGEGDKGWVSIALIHYPVAAAVQASKGVIDKKTWKLIKDKANDALVKAGFDGNGRFKTIGQANSKLADVLSNFGLQLGDVMSADRFREDSRTQNFSIEFVNPSDSFSPVAFDDSMVHYSYTKLSPDRIEVVAYLS